MDKEYLLGIDYDIYEKIFDEYKNTLKGTKYFKDINMKKDNGNIDVFAIRCNDMYVTNDMKRNNDYLVVLNYKEESVEKICLQVTADPKTRKTYIANICEQQYFGNIRCHHWTPGRLAICQDDCKVWVRRYSNSKNFIEQEGNFTINIHDTGGFYNSSLGCIILADETDYHEEFYPLLKNCTNPDYVPVTVIRDTTFENILKSIN